MAQCYTNKPVYVDLVFVWLTTKKNAVNSKLKLTTVFSKSGISRSLYIKTTTTLRVSVVFMLRCVLVVLKFENDRELTTTLLEACEGPKEFLLQSLQSKKIAFCKKGERDYRNWYLEICCIDNYKTAQGALTLVTAYGIYPIVKGKTAPILLLLGNTERKI